MLFILMFILLLAWMIYTVWSLITSKKRGIKIWKTVLIDIGLFLVWIILTAVIASHEEDNAQPKETTQEQHNQNPYGVNIPGTKLIKSKVNTHKFYYTAKDYPQIRYFVNDANKITAIKIVFGSDADITSTVSAQSMIEKALSDDKLKYTNNKTNSNVEILPNEGTYNIYSPKYKKWFWIRLDKYQNSSKNVASVAIYPGKSDEAS